MQNLLCSIFFLTFIAYCAGHNITPDTTTKEYLNSIGINVEDHYATTQDGYILHMFRMPRPGAPVVFLQHGILASSWCWIANTDQSMALGVSLYRQGYDVWLGNNRGNDFSRNHTKLNPNSKEFWDFTFAQMASYDVPAQVDYVLQASNHTNLSFIAHSQGTTQFFIAGSSDELSGWLADRINIFVALSPVTYLGHQSSLLLGAISEFRLGTVLEWLLPYGFLTGSTTLHYIEELLCKLTFGLICHITVDTICGTSELDDTEQIENLSAHFPAGCSVKDLDHYQQLILDDNFVNFDYGKDGNMKHYNTSSPPAFDLSKFNLRTALLHGSQDDLVAAKDLAHLQSVLGSVKTNLTWNQNYQDFSHATWLVGKSSAHQFIDDIVGQLAKYNPVNGSSLNPVQLDY